MKKLFPKIPKKGNFFPNILFGKNVKYLPLGLVALEEWEVRLTSAKVNVQVEAELGNISAVTSLILTKHFGPTYFCGPKLNSLKGSTSWGPQELIIYHFYVHFIFILLIVS